jgi:hypothetical protein
MISRQAHKNHRARVQARSEQRGRPAARRTALKWGLLVAAAAGLVIALGGLAPHRSGSPRLVPADNTVCTTCVSVAGPAANPVLYPGAAPSSIPVTFTNTTNGPIYVTQLQVGFSNAFTAGCPASNFVVADKTPGASAGASGSTTTITYSPAQTIPAGGTWTDSAATLAMPDSHAGQDACQGLPLSMTYTAAANYTVLTTSTLGVASNPSSDSATLTATVAPDIQPASAAHTPGPNDGSVSFYSCSNNASASSCTTLLGTATPNSSGVAVLSIPAGSVGSYNLDAVYKPADPTNFVTSTSPVVTDTLSGCVNAQTAGATTILKTGQTYNGNYTVGSGSSLWLDGGTINGDVTVSGTGQFAATGGAVNGSVQSSGGPVAMAGTTVTGNVQQQNGGLALGPATQIKGNAQAGGGGPVCAQGSSSGQGQVQVQGNLTVQTLTSVTTSSVCNTTVGNNLQWQSNASPGLIGACGGNVILGNLLVQNNSGALTIGASAGANAVSGNVTVSGNTGGGTLTGNKTSGNCQLTGDKPGIVGSANTTGKGQNSCNTSPAGA